MKNINELVLMVQAEGNESYAYIELFEKLNTETIEPKSKSFSRQLKGDELEAHSEGYKLLMELVASWDGTGNFHTLFKTSFDNRLKNLIKYIGRTKRKHNTSYDLSLSESVASVMNMGLASPIIDTLEDDSLNVSFDITEETGQLEMLFDVFAEKYPEQAGIINIASSFTADMKQADKSVAYCEYFGVQTYTEIQKKVSRAKESFKKFLTNNEYNLAF